MTIATAETELKNLDSEYDVSQEGDGLYTARRKPLIHPLYYITPEGYNWLIHSHIIQNPVLRPDGEWVVGYTGPRGGGKSLDMTFVACHDYLLRGKPVWSNIPIKVELHLPNNEVVVAQAFPLDTKLLFTLSDELSGGLVCIDELELYAEARRSQSNKNLLLNYIIMQTRKRALSFFYTIQQPQWADNRLQFMSDLMMRCRDIAYTEWGQENDIQRGHYFSITVEDWSGALTGRKYHETGFSQTFCLWGKPLWGMYNSYDIVDVFEALTPVDLDLNRMKISTTPYTETEEGRIDNINVKLAVIRQSGWREIKEAELWNLLNVEEAQKLKYAETLKSLGVTKRKGEDGWYYTMPEYEPYGSGQDTTQQPQQSF